MTPSVFEQVFGSDGAVGHSTEKKRKLQAETILSDLVDGGKPDRPESDDESSVKSSEREADSDDDDFLT